MKRWASFFISMTLAVSLAACGSDRSGETGSSRKDSDGIQSEIDLGTAAENALDQASEKSTESSATEEDSAILETESQSSHVLIAYFSVPEDVDTAGVDAIAGASIVVREGEALGNTEYVANIIQQTIGGDLFRIETTQQYPLDHDPLVDQAAEEQDADARPELASHIENLDQYDTLILGFPNWWADLPQPLYTFLEEYDLSGKTIIPFVTHGGSGFSNTIDTISSLQPNAIVTDYALSLSRNDVAESRDDVVSWAESLGVN